MTELYNNVAMFNENHTYSRQDVLITHKCQKEAATTVLTANRILYSGRISWENTCVEYCRYVDCDLQNILYEHCVLLSHMLIHWVANLGRIVA